MTGLFYSAGQFALVFGTSTCLTAGANFTVFHDVPAKQIDIFVIYNDFFVGAKLANLWTG
jgi:hypothetical protein